MNELCYFNPPGTEINPGDYCVYSGVKYILKQCDLPEETDIVIGTPWLWKGCTNTEKYKWLKQNQKYKKKIAIGIGSNTELHHNPLDSFTEKNLREICDYWKDFDLIIVRDKNAEIILTAAGLDNIVHLPCPAIFTLDYLDIKPTPEKQNYATCLVTIDPNSQSYSYLDEDTKKNIKGFNNYSVNHYHAFHPWEFQGILELENDLRKLAKYKTIISERIHFAIPFINTHNLSIIPIDSRANTATELGIPIFPTTKKPQINKKDILKKYKEVLNGIQ